RARLGFTSDDARTHKTNQRTPKQLVAHKSAYLATQPNKCWTSHPWLQTIIRYRPVEGSLLSSADNMPAATIRRMQ
ncbi:MAG TPA: hypothetical protein VHM90_22890, partial [Phycisphaerae bacterium]|nr:hypothetical protein [Phycisphaerae bacterium]